MESEVKLNKDSIRTTCLFAFGQGLTLLYGKERSLSPQREKGKVCIKLVWILTQYSNNLCFQLFELFFCILTQCETFHELSKIQLINILNKETQLLHHNKNMCSQDPFSNIQNTKQK